MRIEDRYDTDVDDLWAALTDPGRLARWYGQVEGDLRPGGQFRLHVESADMDATGRVEACEPPRRLLVTTRETDESYRAGSGAPPYDEAIEATLTADGDQTVLVIEVRGMPLDTDRLLRGRVADPRRESRRLSRRARARRQRGAVGRTRPSLSGPGRGHRLVRLPPVGSGPPSA